MINPTVGRILWYRPFKHELPDMGDPGEQPLAAIIAHVHSPSVVNLHVIIKSGDSRALSSVLLIHPGDERPVGGGYCEWPASVGIDSSRLWIPGPPELESRVDRLEKAVTTPVDLATGEEDTELIEPKAAPAAPVTRETYRMPVNPAMEDAVEEDSTAKADAAKAEMDPDPDRIGGLVAG